jgi:hypothetical protein
MANLLEDEVKNDAETGTAPDKKEKKKFEKSDASKDAEIERLKAELFTLQREKEREANREKYRKDPDERKPGISVVDEDGSYTKKKRPNSLGISDLMMPPYTKKQVAIYRIIGTDQINPATGETALPVPTLIPGRYTLFDRFESDPFKKDKVMQNIVGTERYVEDGAQKTREIVEDIIFERGYLAVPVESKFQMYVFMELHPNNRTNKFRPANNTPALFERIDIQHKSPATLAAEQDLGIDAALIIREMTKEDLLKYAIPANIDTTKGRLTSEIRSDLTTKAMKDPIWFFKLKKDTKAGIKIILMDAINLGLLEYRLDNKSYYLTTNEEIFHTHSVGEENLDSLIKAMAKPENEAKFDKLKEQMSFWSTD